MKWKLFMLNMLFHGHKAAGAWSYLYICIQHETKNDWRFVSSFLYIYSLCYA